MLKVTETQIKWQQTLCQVAGVALFLALYSWPYGYYQLLRWLVFIVAGYTASLAFKTTYTGMMWLMLAMAVLFNPVAPIYLSRNAWTLIDIVAAIIFFAAANFLKD